MCLLTLPRHCAVPEKLTTILIEKMPLRDDHARVRSIQNADYTQMWTRYKIQNADCRLSTKRRLRRKIVFLFFLVLSGNRRSEFIFHIISGNIFFLLKWAKNGAKM